MSLAFAAMAVSLAMIAVDSRTGPRHRRYVSLFLPGLAAVGYALATMFLTDPLTTDPSRATFHAKMHVVAASLDWAPLTFLLLAFGLGRNPSWRSRRTPQIGAPLSLSA